METEKQTSAIQNRNSFTLSKKLILIFTLLSAIVSFLTARGIYTNLQIQSIDEIRTQFINQSIIIFFVAVTLGAAFGYVAGRVLTEPIVQLTQSARKFSSGSLDQRIEINTNDELNDLATTFNGMADNIQELITSLEQRVEARTGDLATRSQELETANIRIQRRAAQFEALAQVTQTITALRDLQELLPRIATVISEKFNFYHVGIFLLDDINQFAILVAANSEGGRRMLERKHRLLVGEEGIVGYVAATGKPRIAMDVGTDAVFFNNLDLPNTHSEMALPLIRKNIIVGALDVQSTEIGAFSEEDIQMLSLLADQASLAIENARLFEETRKALAEAEIVSRRSTREAWNRLPEQQKLFGYRYNVAGATALKEYINLTEPVSGKNKGKQAETNQAVVAIELRGQAINTVPPEHVLAFDAWLTAAIMRGDVAELLDYPAHAPHALRNHPTPEHFLPLLVALGAANSPAGRALHENYGILSMAAYQWDN